MKNLRKIFLTLSLILTVVSIIISVYANTNSPDSHYVLYAAFECQPEPSDKVWTKEQLGIIDVLEYGNETHFWLHITVDLQKEPFPLQEEEPIFKYKNKFFRVSPFWVTPGSPAETAKLLQIPFLGVTVITWCITGVLYCKKKPENLALAGLVLLMTINFLNFPRVSASAAPRTDQLLVTKGSPYDTPCEPMPDNSTTDDYFNTTNPYAMGDPMDEVDDPEGDHPLYVLLFGDEEARAAIDWTACRYWFEKADEALIAEFGLDLRILGFEAWESNNGLVTMEELWYNLEENTAPHLGQWYDGEWWSNYADVIFGITAQNTPGDPYPIRGLAPPPKYIDQGRIFILLKWDSGWPWANDNLIQHEVSHLFYAPDHPKSYPDCCAMASHTHYQTFIWEDLHFWPVFSDVPCVLTSYIWCTTCHNLLSNYFNLYDNWNHMLVVRHGYPYAPRGKLSLLPKTYFIIAPDLITISVVSADPGYEFAYWLVDGQTKLASASITIFVDGKHTVAAYFQLVIKRGGGSKTALYETY